MYSKPVKQKSSMHFFVICSNLLESIGKRDGALQPETYSLASIITASAFPLTVSMTGRFVWWIWASTALVFLFNSVIERISSVIRMGIRHLLDTAGVFLVMSYYMRIWCLLARFYWCATSGNRRLRGSGVQGFKGSEMRYPFMELSGKSG